MRWVLGFGRDGVQDVDATNLSALDQGAERFRDGFYFWEFWHIEMESLGITIMVSASACAFSPLLPLRRCTAKRSVCPHTSRKTDPCNDRCQPGRIRRRESGGWSHPSWRDWR